MLSSLAGVFLKPLLDAIIGQGADLFKAYLNKEISIEELRAGLAKIAMATVADIEKSYADALAKTYASFMQTMAQSKLMQATWAAVVLAQLVVLVWHQLGIPALCFFLGNKSCYPSSGTTVEWAYLLLVALMGMGPAVMRAGPAGPGGIVGALKALVTGK